VQKDGPAAQVASQYLLSSLRIESQNSWPDPSSAPGNAVARLRSVRVRTEDGVTTGTVDIRLQVGIEMVYDVLTSGHVLIPRYDVFNEAGLCVFVTQDLDPAWRGRPRPVGTFTSTAWIPGNLLSEGSLLVGAAVFSPDPYVRHFHANQCVAFHVVDSPDGDAARGDWDGPLAGVVRPLLQWTNQHRG